MHYATTPWLCRFSYVDFLVVGGLFDVWDALFVFLVVIFLLWLLLGGHYPFVLFYTHLCFGFSWWLFAFNIHFPVFNLPEMVNKFYTLLEPALVLMTLS